MGRDYLIKYSKSQKDYGGFKPYEPLKIKDDKMKLSSTLHEVIHGILYETGWSAMLDDEKMEEGLTLAIEHGIMQAFDLTIKKDKDA
jgi:hypothetical protein